MPNSRDFRRMVLEQPPPKSIKPPAPVPSLPEFCEGLPIGRKLNFTLNDREWLRPILADTSPYVVLMKGRQIGWSVLLSALMAYYVRKYPGCEIIYCTMAEKQFRYFNHGRLRPMLGAQNDIRPDRGENNITSLRLTNGSLIMLMSGSNGFSQSRGFSADILLLDEAEALPLHEKATILETLHASKIKRTYIGGTGPVEGSEWESEWLQSDGKEWDGHNWCPTNMQGVTSGYHIPQKLSPHWTQEEDDIKRRTYGQFRYETEVLGIPSRAAQIPITLAMVRACKSGEMWGAPAAGETYTAGIDLAAGGDSKTVVAIAKQTGDAAYAVCYAKMIDDDYTADIMPNITPVIDYWNPARIAIDMGGNKELRRAILNKYSQARPYQLTGSKDDIKYGDFSETINRTAFVQRVVERFKTRRIAIPLPPDEPWITEHLTAERMTTRNSADRGTYIAYEPLDGRPNDLLMALAFIEADLFAASDPNNPHNVSAYFRAQFDPRHRAI